MPGRHSRAAMLWRQRIPRADEEQEQLLPFLAGERVQLGVGGRLRLLKGRGVSTLSNTC